MPLPRVVRLDSRIVAQILTMQSEIHQLIREGVTVERLAYETGLFVGFISQILDIDKEFFDDSNQKEIKKLQRRSRFEDECA